MMRRSLHRSQRGVSLIEGMAASAILLTGLIGVFQGIIVASRQNAMANKIARASAIASQIRGGLEHAGRAAVLGGGGPLGACNNGGLAPFAADLAPLAPTCIADLDAFANANVWVPGYTADDRRSFRRVLVHFAGNGIHPDRIVVVVSWLEAGLRRFHTQSVAFFDPARNAATVQL